MKEKGKEAIMDYYIAGLLYYHLDNTGKYSIFCEKCIKQVSTIRQERLTKAQKAGLDVQWDNCGENN